MKIFINFEEVDIDVYAIKAIERSTKWSDEDDVIKFTIIINNQKRIKIETFTPEYTFEYFSEKARDKKYEELKEKMTEYNECKFV